MTDMVGRTVSVGMGRQWIYLKPETWEALHTIAQLEGRTVDELCTAIARRRPPEGALVASIRLFVQAYLAVIGTGPGERPMATAQPAAWVH